MKILVTGSTGFLGSHLVDRLINQGHEVIATSADETKAMTYSWFNEVRYVPYRMSEEKDSSDLFRFFGEPDMLLHLAWEGLPDFKAPRHLDTSLIQQIRFVGNLIRNGLPDITVTGSCLEYGLSEGRLQEDMQANPTTAYGIAKNTLRQYIQALNTQYSFDWKWLRLFYTYGKGQYAGSLIPQLEAAISEKCPYFKMSGGEQLRDYLEISKLSDYIVKLALQNNVLGVINCCSGAPISVRSLVENYLHSSSKSIRLQLGVFPYPDYEPMAFWGDVTKLKRALANE